MPLVDPLGSGNGLFEHRLVKSVAVVGRVVEAMEDLMLVVAEVLEPGVAGNLLTQPVLIGEDPRQDLALTDVLLPFQPPGLLADRAVRIGEWQRRATSRDGFN